MEHPMMGLTTVQLARLALLVRRCEAVQLANGRWGVLIVGRGFVCQLCDEQAPRVAQGAAVDRLLSSRSFPNRLTAENWMRYVGLLPRQPRAIAAAAT